jgi:putative ABC transport system permease protein
VYGVIAYAVSHRRREIGIRLALGAGPARVVGTVFGDAVWMTGVGLGAGLLLLLALGRTFEGLLFGVAATDPGTAGGVALVLASVASLAAWLPARRAARVPPTEALRAE